MSSEPANAQLGPLPFFVGTIERLAEAVERETRDLAGPGPVDYRGHSLRKSTGLLELSRLEPKLTNFRTDARVRAALGQLLAKLEANQKLLHARLRAARTISEVVARAIRDGQSDGTYSAQVWRENRR